MSIADPISGLGLPKRKGRNGKVIHAQGEYQAAETLRQAARIISIEPAALQLRYLQTLTEIAGEKNSTIIPISLDIANGISAIGKKVGAPGRAAE
jgi:regulator of protease activity HflC (stomatin/prohibitin superfamily)